MKYWIVIVVLFYMTEPMFAVAETQPDCVELLRNRCQSCHYLNRVCAQVGEKSERRWRATLKRMVK